VGKRRALRNMAPIGTAKEFTMEHQPEVFENEADTTKPVDTPVVPAEAEPIPAGDPMDHETVPDEDQPNR
jgi:hypothetical protein